MIANQLILGDLSLAVSDALAPAFLLTAIAGFLNAMTTRLFRIHDRIRALQQMDSGSPEQVAPEIAFLEARSTEITRCIILQIGCAICIALFVILVFVSAILSLEIGRLILNVFLLAFILLFASLVLIAWETWLFRHRHW